MPASRPSPPLFNHSRQIRSAHAEAEIFPVGGALHHLAFHLPGGRTVRPLAEAHWHHGGINDVPRHIRYLGGEWPCVPFGTTENDPAHHGYGTDHDWQLIEQGEDTAFLAIDYPDGHNVRRLERRITLSADTAAVDLSLTIHVNTACRLPIGLHPIFHLPRNPGELRILPGSFDHARTAAKEFSPKNSVLAAGTPMTQDGSLTRKDGGQTNLFENISELGEELVQLFDVTGSMRLEYPKAGFATILSWDTKDLPNCLFWIANPGLADRTPAPHFGGLGVEPVASYFDRNDLEAGNGVDLTPDTPWSTHYRIECVPL